MLAKDGWSELTCPVASMDVGCFSLFSHAQLLQFFTAEEVEDRDWPLVFDFYLPQPR